MVSLYALERSRLVVVASYCKYNVLAFIFLIDPVDTITRTFIGELVFNSCAPMLGKLNQLLGAQVLQKAQLLGSDTVVCQKQIKQMETGIVVCRKQFFGSVYLYNIVPAGLSKEWEPQVQLFEGRLCVCELMSKTDDMPWYQFKFDWEDRGIARQQEQNHFFGQTTLIKGTKDLNETVHSREEWYGVLMEYVGHQRLALELRIKDPREDQAFRDLLFRIQEEYEMIDEMMEDADFGECAG